MRKLSKNVVLILMVIVIIINAWQLSIVITDLEMPQMDGHNLTKRIKEDKELQAIPVIIFSSLITEEMRRKGKEVGADEQLSKPEIGHLIGIVDHLLEHSRRKREAGQA